MAATCATVRDYYKPKPGKTLLSARIIVASALATSIWHYATIPTAEALTDGERERVRFVVSTTMDPAALTPIDEPGLMPVALVGESIGGAQPEAAQTGDQAPGAALKRTHVVASGETLSTISNKYDLHSGSVALANPSLKDPEKLQIGQVLVIPDEDAPEEKLAEEKSNRQALQAKAEKEAKSTKKATVLAAMKDTSSTGSKTYGTPVHYSYVSQNFGNGHTGMDFVTNVGTPVKATKSGCLVHEAKGWNGGYGNVIIQDVGGGMTALYGHLSAFEKGGGDCVKAGEVIAYSGNSGRSTGPHLHFEIRKSGTAVNPQKYLP